MQVMTKLKKKFVNVTPLSLKAKDRFENIMESFHACTVENEHNDLLFLVSLNKKYCFWVQKEGNEHWKIDK
jgi:hypothetical protein